MPKDKSEKKDKKRKEIEESTGDVVDVEMADADAAKVYQPQLIMLEDLF